MEHIILWTVLQEFVIAKNLSLKQAVQLVQSSIGVDYIVNAMLGLAWAVAVVMGTPSFFQ